jgi:hypothetical protein
MLQYYLCVPSESINNYLFYFKIPTEVGYYNVILAQPLTASLNYVLKAGAISVCQLIFFFSPVV